jgi:hypothetical protein
MSSAVETSLIISLTEVRGSSTLLGMTKSGKEIEKF